MASPPKDQPFDDQCKGRDNAGHPPGTGQPQMRTLRELRDIWIERNSPEPRPGMAAPFLAYCPPGYQEQRRRVLYVGMATAKDYGLDRFRRTRSRSMDMRIRERLSLARSIFEKKPRSNPQSFWGFALLVSMALDCDAVDLTNLGWSNVCKEGALVKNPNRKQVLDQEDLAVETLRAEMTAVNPDIVVAVSSGCGDDILCRAVDVLDKKEAWSQSENDPSAGVRDVWWIPRRRDYPAVLWMQHPRSRYVNARLREYALDKIRMLTS
jgi:hypothetical protein